MFIANSLLFLFALLFVPLLQIIIGIYIYRDSEKRGMNAPIWTLIAVLGPSVVVLIIYLIIRTNHPYLEAPSKDNESLMAIILVLIVIPVILLPFLLFTMTGLGSLF